MNFDINNIAIISGSGSLPKLLSKKLILENKNHAVVYFSDNAPDWISEKNVIISANFEQIGKLFDELRGRNFDKIVFAGGIKRPQINLTNADGKFLSLSNKILPAMKAGDDTILSLVVEIFEDEGFKILGSENIIPSLLSEKGILTDHRPNKQDFADIERAKNIVNAIGFVDVGQAAVVSDGVCFGIETIQGTEKMLSFVKETLNEYKGSSALPIGILYKAPKPNQNLLVDFPTIGSDTILQALDAGLNGIALKKNGVYILDHERVISLANEHKLFIIVI